MDPSAREAISRLEGENSHEAKSILRRIAAYRDILLTDALHGEVVARSRIPRALAEKHGVKNFYVEDLPSFWRLIYTIGRDGKNVVVTVLEIVDHSAYDKWFPGRGR